MNFFSIFLSEIDFFGTHFHFYLNASKKFKTIYGGLLTILTIFIIIACIIFFGSNLFLKTNPTINQENVNEGYSIIDLKKEKVILAFRMENLDGEFVDFTNKIYPIIYYYSRNENSSTYRSSKTEEFLSYHICNESDYTDINLTQYYGKLFCIDMSNKNFGGYWDNPYIFYYEIRLYFCPNGETYSKSKNCTSMETLNKIFNLDDPMLFSLYYPVYYFDHNSLKQPLNKNYKNYFYYLNHKLQKNDRIYIKHYILYDDQGWMFVNKKKKSVWGVDDIKSDFSYFTEEQLTKENSSSLFYLMNIYMTPEKTYYSRFYTKIQDVMAEVGGLIGVFSSIIRIFCNFINSKFQKIKILDFLFDIYDDNRFNSNYFNKKFRKYDKNYIIVNKDISSCENINKNNYDNNKNNGTIVQMKNNESNDKINTLSLFSLCNINKNNRNSISDSLDSKTKSIKFERNKTKLFEKPLTLSVILRKDFQIYCQNNCKLYSDKKKMNEFFNKYYLVDWFYKESCEVLNYLDKSKLLIFIQNFILNQEQIKGLYLSRKICLSEIKEIKNMKNNINEKEFVKNMSKYFKNAKIENKFSKIDDFIYEIIDDNIKMKIEQ